MPLGRSRPLQPLLWVFFFFFLAVASGGGGFRYGVDLQWDGGLL